MTYYKMYCKPDRHIFIVTDKENVIHCPMCPSTSLIFSKKIFVKDTTNTTNMHGDPLCSSCGCAMEKSFDGYRPYCRNPDCGSGM